MKNFKPIILLALIVLIPLGLLTWLGSRLARDEQAMYETRIRKLLTNQLSLIDDEVREYFDQLDRELEQLTSLDNTQLVDFDLLRDVNRRSPALSQLFVLDSEGNLFFPTLKGSQPEVEFITRTRQILVDKDLTRLAESANGNFNSPTPLLKSPPQPPTQQLQAALPGSVQQELPSGWINTNAPVWPTVKMEPVRGWHVWYLDRGINLIFWHRLSNGFIVAAELNQSRWMSDLFAALPDTKLAQPKRDVAPTRFTTATEKPEEAMRICLVNTAGKVMYQWGQFEPGDSAEPACEISVAEPLSPWRLQYFATPQQMSAGRGTFFNTAAVLAVAAIGLLLLTWFFYRDYARDMQEASQRVSFVNQVSHELRTPLTNIRMYAELLETDIEELPDEYTGKPTERLGVIVSEAGRLSRLIGNVLTFARQERRTLQLRTSLQPVDKVIESTLEHFRPALEQQNIQTEFTGNATRHVQVDPDALEQILGNLINNVEKYAAAGGRLVIESQQNNGTTNIRVADAGPGIDGAMRERIFQPFTRASHGISKVAGTGIGLSIARELARLHGGDLRLVNSEQGAEFEIELKTPSASESNSNESEAAS